LARQEAVRFDEQPTEVAGAPVQVDPSTICSVAAPHCAEAAASTTNQRVERRGTATNRKESCYHRFRDGLSAYG
jgi:hypothetical protein